jgi:hypothetical protein
MAHSNHCLGCRADVARGGGDEEPCPTCGAPTRLRGRWRVLGALARGGSSRVFRGRDTLADRDVALKVLDLADVEDWKRVELFERQLPLLRQLRHPGIPEVYDTFSVSLGGRTRLVLVQSLHHGPSLHDALRDGLRLDEATARVFLGRMLDILEYLHGFSPPILHRDIKPANILLEPPVGDVPPEPRGAGELARAQPVLIDFDTARGVAIDATMADGTMVGSAGYVPLEQLAGRPVPASDLYALGMTMIAALSQRDILELPVERSRLQFHEFVNVSGALEDVLQRMIEPVVEDRLADVAAVRRALREPPARAGPSPTTAARGLTRPREESAAARRGVLGKRSALVACAALVGGGLLYTLRGPGEAAPGDARHGSGEAAPGDARRGSGDAAPGDARRGPGEAAADGRRSPPGGARPSATHAAELCAQVLDAPCEAALRREGAGTASFGAAIALSGDLLAIGDPHASLHGAAHVFARVGAQWEEQAVLEAPAGETNAQFGWALALDGDTLAVGARLAGGPVEGERVARVGTVAVYVRDGSQWAHQAELVGPRAESWFGAALALSGGTLAVSERYELAPTFMATAVTLHVRRDGAWARQGRLEGFRGQAPFGLHGDTLVVGCPWGTADDRTAAVHVYVRDGEDWSLQARLIPEPSIRGFGTSVALEGDTLMVGTPSSGEGPRTQPTSPEEVRVFTRDGTTWHEQAGPDPGPGRRGGFGQALALSGDHLAVLREDPSSADRRRASVFLFTRSAATWQQDRVIDASSLTGSTIALDGARVAIGAPAIAGADAHRWRGTAFVLQR